MGSGKGLNPRLFGATINFRKIGFLIRVLLIWEINRSIRGLEIQNGRQGPQNGRRGLEICLSLGLGRSRQLSQNRFFDLSTLSMRSKMVPDVYNHRAASGNIDILPHLGILHNIYHSRSSWNYFPLKTRRFSFGKSVHNSTN